VRAPAPEPPRVTQAPARQSAPVEPARRARTHRVVAGENLWSIARGELAAGIHAPDDAAIARYWQRVIDANRSTLRSGNPSLIYPGEVIALPEPG
jgi:nucleoid-associated protein YgaU